MPDGHPRRLLISALLGSALFLGQAADAGELTDAVSAGDAAQVKSLLAGGADVAAANRNRETPADLARGNAEVLALLQKP